MSDGASATWNCPTCEHAAGTAPYCSRCGERRLSAHDRTLRGMLEHWIEGLVHVDGRLFRTLRVLFAVPGELTAAFVAGRRQPYLGPFQLFFAVSVVFFVVQGLSGLAILSIPLASHLDHQWYSDVARTLYDAHASGASAEYAAHFEHAERTIAKALVVLMVPLLACLNALVFVRRRVSAATHVTYALHYVTFLQAALCTFFPLLALGLAIARRSGVDVTPAGIDAFATAVEVALVVVWQWFAVARVYSVRGAARVAAVAALALAMPAVLYGYRFIVFLVTLQAT